MLLIITSELWAFRGLHWFLGSGEGRGGKRLVPGSAGSSHPGGHWASGGWPRPGCRGLGFTWWWRDPHPTGLLTQPGWGWKLGQTWAATLGHLKEPPPHPHPPRRMAAPGKQTIQGVILANTNLAFIMNQALFQVLTCIGLIQSSKQPRRHVLLLTPLIIKKWKNEAQRG